MIRIIGVLAIATGCMLAQPAYSATVYGEAVNISAEGQPLASALQVRLAG